MGRRRYGGAFGPRSWECLRAGIPLDRAVLLRLDADQLGTARCRARKAEDHLPPSQSRTGQAGMARRPGGDARENARRCRSICWHGALPNGGGAVVVVTPLSASLAGFSRVGGF